LYATLFETGISRLELSNLPDSHQVGPDFLNVLRVGDLPLALAVAAERTRVILRGNPAVAEFARQVQQDLRWPLEQLELLPP
jgi:hypothetical protein